MRPIERGLDRGVRKFHQIVIDATARMVNAAGTIFDCNVNPVSNGYYDICNGVGVKTQTLVFKFANASEPGNFSHGKGTAGYNHAIHAGIQAALKQDFLTKTLDNQHFIITPKAEDRLVTI